MSRGSYWFAKNMSWAIDHELHKNNKKSRCNSAYKGSDQSMSSEDADKLWDDIVTVRYDPEKKKIIICSAIAIFSASLGATFYFLKIWWPFFCILVFGFISWFSSMLIVDNTDHGTTIKHKVPKGEEKLQGALHTMRFIGCAITFVVSLIYMVPAMSEGTFLSEILGIIALIAIGYPAVCTIKDL